MIASEEIDKPAGQGRGPRRSLRLVLAGSIALAAAIVVAVVLLFARAPCGRPSHRSRRAMPLPQFPQIGWLGHCWKAGLTPRKYRATSRRPSRNWSRSERTALWTPSMCHFSVLLRFFRSTTSYSTTRATPARSMPTAVRFRTVIPLPDISLPRGIGDSKECDTGHEAATSTQAQRWESSCETLSAKVVSFIVVTSLANSTKADDSLSATLTRDAIGHLSRVAGATSPAAVTPPPASLTPLALSDQIYSSPLGSDLLPTGVGLVEPSEVRLGVELSDGIGRRLVHPSPAGRSEPPRLCVLLRVRLRSGRAELLRNTTAADRIHPEWVDRLFGLLPACNCGTYFERASSSSAAVAHVGLCCRVG